MQTRRKTLMQMGAVAAAAALPGCSILSRDNTPLTGYIDAHVHVWTDDLRRYPLGAWASREDMRPATFTDDELMAIAGPCGVDRAVLIQHAPLHGYDNSYILDRARDNPGRFAVVAMINEREPGLYERLRDLRDQGTRGIRIGPTKHADRTLNEDPPNWLNAPGMRLLWEHAAELGVAVCPLVSREFLPTLVPMVERYPQTTCVIDHFGHMDPSSPEDMAALGRLSRQPNVYVKASGFYKFDLPPYGSMPLWINSVLAYFGRDRVMWGSDAPYQMNNGNTYHDAVELVVSGMPALTAADRHAILRGTAERVFFA